MYLETTESKWKIFSKTLRAKNREPATLRLQHPLNARSSSEWWREKRGAGGGAALAILSLHCFSIYIIILWSPFPPFQRPPPTLGASWPRLSYLTILRSRLHYSPISLTIPRSRIHYSPLSLTIPRPRLQHRPLPLSSPLFQQVRWREQSVMRHKTAGNIRANKMKLWPYESVEIVVIECGVITHTLLTPAGDLQNLRLDFDI